MIKCTTVITRYVVHENYQKTTAMFRSYFACFLLLNILQFSLASVLLAICWHTFNWLLESMNHTFKGKMSRVQLEAAVSIGPVNKINSNHTSYDSLHRS